MSSEQLLLLDGDGQQVPGFKRLPTWWLVVIALYSMCDLTAVFDGIVLPAKVAELAGEDHKHAALGALISLRGWIHLTLPLVGTATDTWRTPIGRRRPVYILGVLLTIGGLAVCRFARHITLLAVGCGIYYAGCMISYVPYTTVIPDLVPLSQRSTAAAWITGLGAVAGYGGYSLGILVGDGKVSNDDAVTLAIISLVIGSPFGWWSLSPRPGFCVAEYMPPLEQEPEAEPAHHHPTASGGMLSSGLCAKLARFPGHLVAATLEVFSALRESRSFRWNWLGIFFNNLDISGIFFCKTHKISIRTAVVWILCEVT